LNLKNENGHRSIYSSCSRQALFKNPNSHSTYNIFLFDFFNLLSSIIFILINFNELESSKIMQI
jgi:hypothetical protein